MKEEIKETGGTNFTERKKKKNNTKTYMIMAFKI